MSGTLKINVSQLMARAAEYVYPFDLVRQQMVDRGLEPQGDEQVRSAAIRAKRVEHGLMVGTVVYCMMSQRVLGEVAKVIPENLNREGDAR